MAWYDEEEDDDPFAFSGMDDEEEDDGGYDFGGFGAPSMDFSQFNPPQAQTPSPDESLYDMSELYNVPAPNYNSRAMDEYSKYVQSEPRQSDFKNKWWQNLAGGFIGGLDATERGVAAGRNTRQNYLDQPYLRQRAEWSQRAKQMGEQARIEQQRNNLERQRYQQGLTSAQARVNAKRQQVLAKNTLTDSADRRDTNAVRRSVLPLASFVNREGKLVQYDKRNPLTQNIVGTSAQDNPVERTARLRARLQATRQNQQTGINAADNRARLGREATAEQNRLYRDPAGTTPKTARTQADIANERQNNLDAAYTSPDFDNLRRTRAIGRNARGQVIPDMNRIDAALARIRETPPEKRDKNSDDYKIAKEWFDFQRKYGGK